MRSTLVFTAFLVGLALLFSGARRGDSATVTVSSGKRAFLIRFGLDGKEGADWSGSVVSPRVRIRGWQFNAGDSVSGAGWKCATEHQNYWDTPYEARMQPTSNREKVTGKGVILDSEGEGFRAIAVATSQGRF